MPLLFKIVVYLFTYFFFSETQITPGDNMFQGQQMNCLGPKYSVTSGFNQLPRFHISEHLAGLFSLCTF